MSLEVVLVLMQVVVLMLAFCVHECAHAWTAWRLGDPTAKLLGRITLNPIKHLDPFGSVIFPLIGLFYGGMLFGWAKPTPVTSRNFKNYRRDDIMVSLAGPASNLLMAIVALILLLVMKHAVAGGVIAIEAAHLIAHHVRGIPIDSLPSLFPVALFLYYVILLNLLLFVFNLIPVPPLDGSRILRHFLPYNALLMYDRIGMFGMIFIMLIGGSLIFRLFLYPLQSTFDGILAAL
jgi:Zn-dependent protease